MQVGEKSEFFFIYLGYRLPVILGLAFLAGCAEVAYYGQAVRGHVDVMSRSRPIGQVLAASDDGGETELQQALRSVPGVLAFAEKEMGLSPGRSYRSYADLERPYVVWNVFAADEFDLEPKTWWYPLVGSLSYRGFFSARAAHDHAAQLQRKGYDVVVAGVRAYSTLGWFGDPVLNTFITLEEPDFVALICHELAHRKLFFRGDTALSEAFATVIEEEARARWINKGPLDRQQRFHLARREQLLASLEDAFEQARTQLRQLYSSYSAGADLASLRARKVAIFEVLKRQSNALIRAVSPEAVSKFNELPFNNARLAIDHSYRRLVPAVRAILMDECNGDLERFYREMKNIQAGQRPRPCVVTSFRLVLPQVDLEKVSHDLAIHLPLEAWKPREIELLR